MQVYNLPVYTKCHLVIGVIEAFRWFKLIFWFLHVCTIALKCVNLPNYLSKELQETTSCFLSIPCKFEVVCSRIAACQEDGKKLLKTFLWLICFSCNIKIFTIHLWRSIWQTYICQIYTWRVYSHGKITKFPQKLPNSRELPNWLAQIISSVRSVLAIAAGTQ